MLWIIPEITVIHETRKRALVSGVTELLIYSITLGSV